MTPTIGGASCAAEMAGDMGEGATTKPGQLTMSRREESEAANCAA